MGKRKKLTIKEFRNRKKKGLRNNLLKRATTKSFVRPDAFKFEDDAVSITNDVKKEDVQEIATVENKEEIAEDK
jgi:hypothetical protein